MWTSATAVGTRSARSGNLCGHAAPDARKRVPYRDPGIHGDIAGGAEARPYPAVRSRVDVSAASANLNERSHAFYDRTVQTMNQFKSLRASSLYCQKCRATNPVRERLLLILPDREIYDYLCTNCGTSVGSREVRSSQESGSPLIVP